MEKKDKAAMHDMECNLSIADDNIETKPMKKVRLQDDSNIISDDDDRIWKDCKPSWELIGTNLGDIQIKYKRRNRIRLLKLTKMAEREERSYAYYKAESEAQRSTC